MGSPVRRDINILSLDGGGVRGLISAVLLEALMGRINQDRRRPLAAGDLFDLVAGTSAGGLIALALTMPGADGEGYLATPSDLVRLFRDRGADIFPLRPGRFRRRLRQYIRPKYGRQGLDTVLKDLLGNRKFSDAKTALLLLSYDTLSDEPVFFKNRPVYWLRRPGHPSDDADIPAWHAAAGTASAPSYFPAFRTRDSRGTPLSLIDGAVFGNNPAVFALIEAMKMYPGRRYRVLSVGTGFREDSLTWERIHRWGLLGWANPFRNVPLLQVMGAGQRDSALHVLDKHPDVDFHRWDVYDEGWAMDDARPHSLEQLEEAARRWTRRHASDVTDVARRLRRPADRLNLPRRPQFRGVPR